MPALSALLLILCSVLVAVSSPAIREPDALGHDFVKRDDALPPRPPDDITSLSDSPAVRNTGINVWIQSIDEDDSLSLRSSSRDVPSSTNATLYTSPIETRTLMNLLNSTCNDLTSKHKEGVTVFHQHTMNSWSFQLAVTQGDGISYALVFSSVDKFLQLTPPNSVTTWTRAGIIVRGSTSIADLFIAPVVQDASDFQSAVTNYTANVDGQGRVYTQTSLPDGFSTAYKEYKPLTLDSFAAVGGVASSSVRASSAPRPSNSRGPIVKRQASVPRPNLNREVRLPIPGTPFTLTVFLFVDSSSRLREANGWQFRYAVSQALNNLLSQTDRMHQGSGGGGDIKQQYIDSGIMRSMKAGTRFRASMTQGPAVDVPTWANLGKAIIAVLDPRQQEQIYAVHGRIRGPSGGGSGGEEKELGEWYLNAGAFN
ncbi:MAG: hypothetical protein LQ342_000566 [Letrouitia transgressa]|nr:MAG: hypothetical protein LQ342_000566 [Letrouitia transgressa]